MQPGKPVRYRLSPQRYLPWTRRSKRPVRSAIFVGEISGARGGAGVFQREETYGLEQGSRLSACALSMIMRGKFSLDIFRRITKGPSFGRPPERTTISVPFGNV